MFANVNELRINLDLPHALRTLIAYGKENTNNLEDYIYSKGITLAAPKPCTGSTLSSELSATHLPLYGWASCLQRHGTGRRNGRICGQKAVMRQYALRSIRTEPNWFRSARQTIPWSTDLILSHKFVWGEVWKCESCLHFSFFYGRMRTVRKGRATFSAVHRHNNGCTTKPAVPCKNAANTLPTLLPTRCLTWLLRCCTFANVNRQQRQTYVKQTEWLHHIYIYSWSDI